MLIDADRDQLILAMVAFDEASDQGVDGIRAQIWSVLNRHTVGKWYSRKTIAGTCLLSWQYSALNNGDPNRERGAEVPTNDPTFQLCDLEVMRALAGITKDPTGGATHYYAAGTPVPAWADPATGAVFTVQIGRHRFYRNVK